MPSAADVTFFPGGTGAVSRSVESKERDIVSVMDFGVGHTNISANTAKIQAALNTGRVLYFPAGNYFVYATLTMSPGGGIIGEGERTKFIRQFSGGPTIGHAGGTQAGDPIRLENFMLDTDIGTVTVSANDTGIDIGYASTGWAQRRSIANLLILRQWNGFKWTGGTMGPMTNIQAISNKGSGFYGVNPRGELSGCLSQFNNGNGYLFYAATQNETGVQIRECGTFSNGGVGFLFDAAQDVSGANIFISSFSSSFDSGGGVLFLKPYSQVWLNNGLIENSGQGATFGAPYGIPNIANAKGLVFTAGCQAVQGSNLLVNLTNGGGVYMNSVSRISLSNLTVQSSNQGGGVGADAVGVNLDSGNFDVVITALVADYGVAQSTDLAISSAGNTATFVSPTIRTYYKGSTDKIRFIGANVTQPPVSASGATLYLPDYCRVG